MSLLGMNATARDQPTTEWDDIQRRIGNLPPLVDQALAFEAAAKAESSKPPKSSAAAETMGPDEESEDAELARIRAERLEELRGGSSKQGCFGSVLPLSRVDYTKEVNQAGDGVGVVVFLSKSKGHYLSSYTLVLLEKLAKKFTDVKFLQIESDDCIPGYPDANLPTLLIYRDDILLRQCTGPSAFGGTSFGVDSVEWELAQSGVIETELPRCPHATASTAVTPES